MARKNKKITPKTILEIFRYSKKNGLGIRKTAKVLGIPRSTVSDYCKRFDKSKTSFEEFESYDEEKRSILLFPENNSRMKDKEKPLPDFEYIHKEIAKKGVTFELLHQEYLEENPNGYSLSHFKNKYYEYKNKLTPSMRQVYIPGEKMFIDYSGLTVDIHNNKTGEITKAQIFVSVLGASGYTFVHATNSQKKEDFIKSHVLAFDFYGGVPKILVPDNLKSAIIKNNKKDGLIPNESYLEMARFYDCIIEPARPRKPQDKAKAEQGVQAIQRWILAILRKRKFFDVDELNDGISPLLDSYNNKIMKKIAKSRTQLFKEIEEEFLKSLPTDKFEYCEFKQATVNMNYHIELDSNHYSVPYKYLKEKVEVKYSSKSIYIYLNGNLIALHLRSYNKFEYITKKEHMPPNHQYQHEKMNPDRLLNWSESIGEDVYTFVKKRFLSTKHPPNVYSNVIAVLQLAKTYGKCELNLALKYANNQNIIAVRHIKSILDKKLYLTESSDENTKNDVFNQHENIRGSKYYK